MTLTCFTAPVKTRGAVCVMKPAMLPLTAVKLRGKGIFANVCNDVVEAASACDFWRCITDAGTMCCCLFHSPVQPLLLRAYE